MMNQNEQPLSTVYPEGNVSKNVAGVTAPMNSVPTVPQASPVGQASGQSYQGYVPYPPQTGGAVVGTVQPQSQSQSGNAPVNPYPNQPKAVFKGRKSQSRDLVMAILVAVLSFGMMDCLLWAGGIGAGFALGAGLLLAVSLAYLKHDWRHTGFYTVACVAVSILGCVSLVFSADSGMKLLTLLCLLILFTCILMDGMELREWTPGTFRSIGDFFYTAFAASFGKIGAGMYGLFHREREANAKQKAVVGKAMLGLLIAVPIAALLIVLLSGADQAFQGMLESIDLSKFSEKIWTLFLAVPMFILVFSQLFCIRDIRRNRREESGKGLDPTILTFFLLGVSLVYVAYLFSQLSYFFNGFLGFLPEGFTHAEYARRGFFELTAVSVINILIVILSTALSRKQGDKLPLGVQLTSLFLCVFSLVLVFTEAAKMKMYMDAFGLTRLRILTTLFMIFLAVVFAALMIHIFVRRFPYLKTAVVVGAVFVVAINFIGVDRMVAEYNVQAYQSGALNTVDVDTITELSAAAVPSLIELADDKDPQVAQDARDELYARWRRLHQQGEWDYVTRSYSVEELKPYDFRGFDLASYQARQLLLENEKLFMPKEEAPL